MCGSNSQMTTTDPDGKWAPVWKDQKGNRFVLKYSDFLFDTAGEVTHEFEAAIFLHTIGAVEDGAEFLPTEFEALEGKLGPFDIAVIGGPLYAEAELPQGEEPA